MIKTSLVSKAINIQLPFAWSPSSWWVGASDLRAIGDFQRKKENKARHHLVMERERLKVQV